MVDRWKEGEEAVAGVGGVLYDEGLAGAPSYIDVLYGGEGSTNISNSIKVKFCEYTVHI